MTVLRLLFGPAWPTRILSFDLLFISFNVVSLTSIQAHRIIVNFIFFNRTKFSQSREALDEYLDHLSVQSNSPRWLTDPLETIEHSKATQISRVAIT